MSLSEKSQTAVAKVLTIDGPSGSGKGTISLLIAQRLGWHFLDSGALYRVLARYAIDKKIALSDEAAVSNLANNLPVEFQYAFTSHLSSKIILAGVEVTTIIRSETCANAASKIAALPAVRDALLARQRAFLKPPGLVADGRDMGTVVFPHAFCKVFLEASVQERAKRRYLQLKEQGLDGNLQKLIGEISNRDARDKQRVISPMIPAQDAIIVDTTGFTITEVLKQVMTEVAKRL